MNVIHLIHSLDKINFGIYNAAVFGSQYLSEEHNVSSYVFACSGPSVDIELPGVSIIYLGSDPLNPAAISSVLKSHNISKADTVVVSHGCWLAPSRLGYALSKLGFAWIYVPHGMLEPWSMKQNFIKKLLYFQLAEKRYARKSKGIRAVSLVEQTNLAKQFGRKIALVENGVFVKPYRNKSSGPVENFLFLGRLHYKKGVLPLVAAWQSVFGRDIKRKLTIAGPDQGELEKIKPYLGGNIEYAGPVYGDAKERLLAAAHFFVLPSFSEGFPVSVLEAMSFGIIPMISSGCNFDEVFEQGLGYRIEPDQSNIEAVFRETGKRPFDDVLSEKNWKYTKDNYSEPIIANRLLNLYQSML